MRKVLNTYRALPIMLVALFTGRLAALEVGGAPRYVIEMHAPVPISMNRYKGQIFFFKNNLRHELNSYVGIGDIYFFQTEPIGRKMEYVGKIVDDEIVSVFFAHWSTSKGGRSMYVLARSRTDDDRRDGYQYSVTEYPFGIHEDRLTVRYYPGDGDITELQDCFEGINKLLNIHESCKYKTAADVKAFLRGLH
jgi:hypothetical protein